MGHSKAVLEGGGDSQQTLKEISKQQPNFEGTRRTNYPNVVEGKEIINIRTDRP